MGSGLGFGGTFVDVVDDLVGEERAADGGVALGAFHRLGGFEGGDVGDLGRGDGPVDALG